MVLLDVLARVAKANRWKLAVAHLNHGLRGADSDADQKLVQREAKRLKLPFFGGREDVREVAKTGGFSLEMAARKARHEFLARTAARHGARIIALAHHADDQLELFFLRLLRGSGPEGLSGMKYVNASPAAPRISLVRPLLATPKSVLRAYATEHNVRFREDTSNAQLDFQRNRIRAELLPLLRRHYQPALDRTVARVAEIIQAESEFVTAAARRWLAGNGDTQKHRQMVSGTQREPNLASIAFAQLPVALQRRCLYLQLLDLGVEPDFAVVEQLRLHPEKPWCVQASEPTMIRNVAGRVLLSRAEAPSLRAETPYGVLRHKELLDLASGRGEAQFSCVKFEWQIRRHPLQSLISPRPGRERFDADRIGAAIVLRHWQPGDRFQPIGMTSAVKLQDLFVNARIPRTRRHELVVGTTRAGEIFWVEGLRIGERFKLQKSTKRALHWRWQRG